MMDFKSDWGTCGILLAGVVGLSALLLSPVRLPAQGDPGHVHLAAATKDDVGIHALAVVVLTNRPMEHHCFTNATISFPDGTGGPGWGCQDIYHLVAIDSVAGMFENGTVQEAFPAADWDPINTPAGVTHLTNGQWSMPTPGQFTAPLFDDVLMAVTSQDPGDADVDWYKYKQVWSIIQVKQNADGTYPPNALPGGAAAKPITLNSHDLDVRRPYTTRTYGAITFTAADGPDGLYPNAAPTNLQVAGGAGSATLMWTEVPGALAYNVQRAPAQADGTAGQFMVGATTSILANNINAITPTWCTYTDSINNAGTYYYKVAGCNPVGCGPYCTPVTGVVQ